MRNINLHFHVSKKPHKSIKTRLQISRSCTGVSNFFTGVYEWNADLLCGNLPYSSCTCPGAYGSCTGVLIISHIPLPYMSGSVQEKGWIYFDLPYTSSTFPAHVQEISTLFNKVVLCYGWGVKIKDIKIWIYQCQPNKVLSLTQILIRL